MNTEITGKLIKAGGQRAPKLVKNQIISAKGDAAVIRAEAEAFAAMVRRQAEEDAESIRQQAYDEGTEAALAELEGYLVETKEIREKVWRETEKDLLRLSVRLAERIVGREIEKDDKTIIDIVSTALQNARQQEKLTVRVNPKDLPAIEKESERISSGRIQFIDLVADPRVPAAGCLIESEVGTIDARIETQLRVLERALLSRSEGEGSEG